MNEEEQGTSTTMDGTVDYHGRPALKEKTGRWTAGTIILGTVTHFLFLFLFMFFARKQKIYELKK